MTLREMYSSYSLLQRISKRKQISKTGGFCGKKKPEESGARGFGVFFQFIFNFLLYNFFFFYILFYLCYCINKTRGGEKNEEIY